MRRKVGAIVGAAALFASQGGASDEHSVDGDVVRLPLAARFGLGQQVLGLLQFRDAMLQFLAVANDAGVVPHQGAHRLNVFFELLRSEFWAGMMPFRLVRFVCRGGGVTGPQSLAHGCSRARTKDYAF